MALSGVWSWKEEPASPLIQLDVDSWLSASDNVAVEVELTDEVKVSRAEHASKLLQDLDQWTKEEEQFPDWLEEKIELPIFEDLPPPMVNMDMVPMKPMEMIKPMNCLPSPKQIEPLKTPICPVPMKNLCQIPEMKTMNCQIPEMKMNCIPLMDMKHPEVAMKPNNVNVSYQPQTQTVMDSALMQELLQDYPQDTLTPPESPRGEELVFTMLQEMQPHELDELVRMRVESLVESPAEYESESVGSPSPSMSPSTSDSGYSDPEWTMASTSDARVPKRRRITKPYSRTPPEEKRLRKKEQNKNAATRYRLKKKQEIEEILGEEKQLQVKNEQLKTELTELGREIKYLKNLMRDLFKAKGLIK